MNKLRRAAIVAPIRTPVGKFGGALASLNAGELGGIILKALMERTKLIPHGSMILSSLKAMAVAKHPVSAIGLGWRRGYRLKCPAIRLTDAVAPACKQSRMLQ